MVRIQFEDLCVVEPGGGEIGKKLDFLLQEMGREVNTIGSKGNGARSSESVIVSPMNTSSKPVRPTTSPACASEISIRFNPSKWKMAVILACVLRPSP